MASGKAGADRFRAIDLPRPTKGKTAQGNARGLLGMGRAEEESTSGGAFRHEANGAAVFDPVSKGVRARWPRFVPRGRPVGHTQGLRCPVRLKRRRTIDAGVYGGECGGRA